MKTYVVVNENNRHNVYRVDVYHKTVPSFKGAGMLTKKVPVESKKTLLASCKTRVYAMELSDLLNTQLRDMNTFESSM